MSLLFRMAWRNLFRNRRRTFLTATIIAMGLMSLILMDAVMTGMVSNMVATATDTFLGQAQVHAKGFRAEKRVEWTVDHLPEVEATLSRDPSVAAFVERTLAVAMVGSASDAESVLLYGIDPGRNSPFPRSTEPSLEGGT
jgi:ABC-type lipoprotein release transport system permease subunit